MKKSAALFLSFWSSFPLLLSGQTADDAGKWFAAAQKTIPQAAHLSAAVELETGENEYVHFRVDRTPELTRVHADNGDTFVQEGEKPWLRSQDWDYTGVKASAEQEAKLNYDLSIVVLPLAPFQTHDPSQGGQVWRLKKRQSTNGETLTTFEQSREHPRPNGVYPEYTYAEGKEGSPPVLRFMSAQLRGGKGKSVPIVVEYHVLTPEQSEEVRRRDLVAEVQSLKAGMSLRPVTVDGEFTDSKPVKIHGLVEGVNSDLEITTEDGKRQHVVVHDGRCWISEDGGKKWQAQAEPDRSYARMIFGPLVYNGRKDMGSPDFFYKEIERKKTDGGVQEHLRVSNLQDTGKKVSETEEVWLTRPSDGEAFIHRVQSPVIFLRGGSGHVEGEYAFADASVRPPAGVELRLPKLEGDAKPEALLQKAKQFMAHQSRWKVNGKIEEEAATSITGIVDGHNSDLSITAKDGSVIHQVIVGDLMYVSQEGKKWKKEKLNRDFYHLVANNLSYDAQEEIPPFEIVEQQWSKEGGALVHIRLRSPQASNVDTDRNNYWLEILPGGNIWITRYVGPMVYQGHYLGERVDYEPVDKNTPPVKAPSMSSAK